MSRADVTTTARDVVREGPDSKGNLCTSHDKQTKAVFINLQETDKSSVEYGVSEKILISDRTWYVYLTISAVW